MTKIHRREILLYLLSLITFGLQKKITAKEILTTWNSIRKISMKGGLRAFWSIHGHDNVKNQRQALARGFKIATTPNVYADYKNKQERNIYNFLEKERYINPWKKPDFFDTTINQNLENIDPQASIVVHDIEFNFNKDIEKAWKDENIRKYTNANNFTDFTEKYYQEWAKWFTKSCHLHKKLYPSKPIGIYGPQVFNRDFWGFTKSLKELEQSHSHDLRLWKYIDPYVDFYAISTYIFYDLPDSIYYIAANIEENYRRSRQFGNKPIYVYEWLKYHPSNQKLSEQELAPYLAEASAVIPFFTGAKGVVLWGWEPKKNGPYFQNLPIFMNSLGRVSDLSHKLGQAKLIIDRTAHELWREKQPLIRKFKVSNSEWILMAVYPWQKNEERKIVATNCGAKSVNLEIRGKHTEIYHLQSGILKRISM